MPEMQKITVANLGPTRPLDGMFAELGIGDFIDKATQQNPELGTSTWCEAVKAMVRKGLG